MMDAVKMGFAMMVYFPMIVAYIMYADTMIEKAAEKIEAMFAAKKMKEVTMASEFFAAYGEMAE
jgi:hypothetical protein